MAYEALTGRPPFHGRSQQQVLTAHLTEPPPPLGSRAPQVPPALGALVMRCLAKSPADRPQSAKEIVRELEGLGSTGTTGAHPSFSRRSRSALIGAWPWSRLWERSPVAGCCPVGRRSWTEG
jgi:serine/threonine protein kinase